MTESRRATMVQDIGNPPCTDCRYLRLCTNSVTLNQPFGISCKDFTSYSHGTKRFRLRDPNTKEAAKLFNGDEDGE